MATNDNTSRRTRQQYLTDDERTTLMSLYVKGVRARLAAEQLGCSIRIINKYYSYFAAEGIKKSSNVL